MFNGHLFLPLIISLALYASTAQGAIVVNNLNQDSPSGGGISGPSAGVATRFVVAGSREIDRIKIDIREQTRNNPDQMVLKILSDSAATPGGTVLGTLSSTTNITSRAEYVFAPTAGITLPGGAYWLAGMPTGSNASYSWWVTTSENDADAFGWSHWAQTPGQRVIPAQAGSSPTIVRSGSASRLLPCQSLLRFSSSSVARCSFCCASETG